MSLGHPPEIPRLPRKSFSEHRTCVFVCSMRDLNTCVSRRRTSGDISCTSGDISCTSGDINCTMVVPRALHNALCVTKLCERPKWNLNALPLSTTISLYESSWADVMRHLLYYGSATNPPQSVWCYKARLTAKWNLNALPFSTTISLYESSWDGRYCRTFFQSPSMRTRLVLPY
jgi:hypothetical protein